VTTPRGLGIEVGRKYARNPDVLVSRISAILKETKILPKAKVEVKPAEEILKPFTPQQENLKRIFKLVTDGDAKKTEELVVSELKKGTKPLDLIEKALLPGALAVAKLYDAGYCYVPEVLLSSGAMNAGLKHCKAAIGETKKKGKIVMHVADGDIHEIGKNIVKAILEAKGYEVIDLGPSVPPDKVVEAVKTHKPLAVSGTSLMTTTRMTFPKIAKMLADEGIDIPFIVAGGAVNQQFAEQFNLGIYAKGAEQGEVVLRSVTERKSWKDIRKEIHSSY